MTEDTIADFDPESEWTEEEIDVMQEEADDEYDDEYDEDEVELSPSDEDDDGDE